MATDNEHEPSELEATIRQLAADIHIRLGPGHLETIYHAAMEVGLRLRGIEYETKRVVEVKYEGHCVGREEADLVVAAGDEAIVRELKVVAELGASRGPAASKLHDRSECGTGLFFPSLGKNATAPSPIEFWPLSSLSERANYLDTIAGELRKRLPAPGNVTDTGE
jgi:GxxExxY protein